MTDGITDDGAPISEDSIVLAPDASILSALGRGHTLASALADLIDNSIDAGATRVGIRFVTHNATVRSIRILDDGCGMTAEQLERAMTLGRGSDHASTDLGHFRVGLKAASLSQARMLTVLSTTGFSPASGMRLNREQSGPTIRADVIDPAAAATVLERRGLGADSGTAVEWAGLESVSTATSYHARRDWFEAMIIQLRDELGLTFHRLLSDGRIRIQLDELDENTNTSGAPRMVKPIDPFAFANWGAADYPKTLEAELPAGPPLTMRCYILPPAVEGPSANPLGRARSTWQGLFIYRNDRLLHSGGWLQLGPDDLADLQLARAVIDLTPEALDAVAMNAEKRGVVLRPAALQAIERARTDGFSLRSFLDEAREVWRRAHQRDLAPQPFAAAGAGAPDGLAELVESTVGVREDAAELAFDWAQLEPRQLYAFEPATGLVRLNIAHRGYLEEDIGRLELLKTSLFLLLEPHAGKERLAPHTRQRLDVAHAALAASVLKSRMRERPSDASPAALGDVEGSPYRESEDEDDQDEDEVVVLIESIVSPRSDPYEPLADPAIADVPLNDDVFKDFLRRASEYALLTAEEEVDLAREIEIGVCAEGRIALLRGGEWTQDRLDLEILADRGRKAMDRMVGANLRLVINLAKRYRGHGLELPDLAQEGTLGLIRAVQKFDRFQGTKFSTYATWWIRQSVARAVADQGRLIRFPVHVVDRVPAITAATLMNLFDPS
ncbi:MAG: sigma-70 family RNA polymerase sigma factor [Micrococcales bacterium]|nr:sigma-70 family RNA polymerase sigma factor [Micrococcales bacterium]